MSRDVGESKQKTFLVVDDHEAILAGTVPALEDAYPEATVLTARDIEMARLQMRSHSPTLIVLDLSLPEKPQSPASAEYGLAFLKTIIADQFAPNILVLSTNIQPLVQLKPMINAYEGGFAAMDKSLPIKEMLRLVDFSLQGLIYLPSQMRSRHEFDAKWLEVLQLKYEGAMTDKAIAKKMAVSDRTIRNYWLRIQDALEVYDEPGIELRIQIEKAARKIGLIS